jgi:tetratricopeptide (TPR) repeat protein
MDGDLHNSVGMAYMNMGASQEAARSFARSITLQPSTGNCNNLGRLRLLGLGDVRGAIEAYLQCVTLDPTDHESLTPLAGAWLDIGDIEAASRAVAKALDLAPNRGWSHWMEGLILRQQGRRREALALMQASLDDPATVHRFGSFLSLTKDVVRFHMEDGDFDAAKTRLLKSYPDLLARLTPPANLRGEWWGDPTALFIQVLRAKGEDEKAARLTPYTDTFSEDYFRRLGQPLTNGFVNWVLATAALAAGDDARALDYLQAAYEGGLVANWRSRYGAPDFYALWDHPRHKALMARIEADMQVQRAAMMAEAAE